jgi:hypothetical protein
LKTIEDGTETAMSLVLLVLPPLPESEKISETAAALLSVRPDPRS